MARVFLAAGVLVVTGDAPPERCAEAALRAPVAIAEALRLLVMCLTRGPSAIDDTACTSIHKV